MARSFSLFGLVGDRELFGLGRVVDTVGEFDRAEVVEVLVEEVEVVLLQVLQVVLCLNAPKKSSEGVLREGLWMLSVDLDRLFVGTLAVGCDL